MVVCVCRAGLRRAEEVRLSRRTLPSEGLYRGGGWYVGDGGEVGERALCVCVSRGRRRCVGVGFGREGHGWPDLPRVKLVYLDR